MSRLVRLILVTVLAGIVYSEVRKVPGETRFQGKALGFVPYDIRPPSLAKIPSTYWNPHEPRIFTGRVSGIGWSINVAALVERIRRL
jgi:hypothetical protein